MQDDFDLRQSQEHYESIDGRRGEKDRYAGRLICLPFDRADYGPTMSPCQLLAMTYYVAGLHYYVKTDMHTEVSVGKKQLAALMEAGRYAAVVNPIPKMILGGSGLSIQISLSSIRTLYMTHYYAPLSWDDLSSIFHGHIEIPKGKMPRKVYRFDPETGRGSNMQDRRAG